MEHYAGIMPEAIDTFTPEDRYYVYKQLKLKVMLHAGGTPEVSGMFGDALPVSNKETLSRSPARQGETVFLDFVENSDTQPQHTRIPCR
jgi:hypothetical protein